MELRILSPQEGGFLKEIKWNNEELKKEIALKMEEYKTLVYTDDTIKDAKVDRATLNKLVKAIDDERKRIKRLCLAPVEQFEAQVKELVALVDEPIKLIDKQIKEVEEQKRIEKKRNILAFYEEHVGSLKGILPFDKAFKTEYLNVGKSMKSIQEEIQELFDTVNTDLDTIEGFDTKYQMQMKDVYIRTLDLSAAMREKARLEDVEKRLGERRVKEQAERDALIEQQKQEGAITAAGSENLTYDSPIKEKPERKEEPELKIDFRVTGTKEQIMAVRQFMIDNKIKFGKVE